MNHFQFSSNNIRLTPYDSDLGFESPYRQFNLNNLNNSLSNSLNNLSASLNSSNSNLGQLIRNDLNDVNLYSKLNLDKKEVNSSIMPGKFLYQRSYGNRIANPSSDFGLRKLISNNLLKENQLHLGQIDKIYSSCWLSDDFVICGTKCNKLVLINLNNKKHYFLPVVESRNNLNKSGGLYSLTTNPSKQLLVTGTSNGNDLAIYKLPSLDVLFLLENGHRDFIFDVEWLDDNFLISGSRDSNIVLWKVLDESNCEFDEENNLYKMNYLNPTETFNYGIDVINKIRCLTFNRKYNEIGALAFNAKFHSIDALTMKKKMTSTLSQLEDLVCLTNSEDNELYAIGSKSHVMLIDSSTLEPVATIGAKDVNCGIRSLSFNSKILTVCTGHGRILFFDIRNLKYFNNHINQDLIELKTSKGWVQRSPQDYQNYGHFTQIDKPAIYTHQYDQTKTRLLTAGGPLTSSLVGNYCALWS